jgi:hypothetical protein
MKRETKTKSSIQQFVEEAESYSPSHANVSYSSTQTECNVSK